jgi:hypothetical protein
MIFNVSVLQTVFIKFVWISALGMVASIFILSRFSNKAKSKIIDYFAITFGTLTSAVLCSFGALIQQFIITIGGIGLLVLSMLHWEWTIERKIK